MNPFIWSSFESICNIGEKIDPNKYFTFNSALSAYKNQILDTNALNLLTNQLVSPDPKMNFDRSPNVKDTSQISHHQKQQQNIQNQILKQIDPQNDFLDQKNRLEIANMLKLVESDQQANLSKLTYKKDKIQQQAHHHSNCVHHKQNQEQFSNKVSKSAWPEVGMLLGICLTIN